jgi:hypothetical protein
MIFNHTGISVIYLCYFFFLPLSRRRKEAHKLLKEALGTLDG